MKQLASYFFQGLLFMTPIGVTIYVIVFAFTWIDGLLRDLKLFNEGALSDYSFPGIGVLIILVGVTLAGFLGQKLIFRPLFAAFERLLHRAPIVKIIYTSVKELLSAFVGKERKFEKPVLVKLDNSSVVRRLGFITATDLEHLGISKEFIGVYLPSSYGLLGELLIVPASNVEAIDAHSAEVMKFIVSGGVSKLR
jgi:uncharacterized membrane protein